MLISIYLGYHPTFETQLSISSPICLPQQINADMPLVVIDSKRRSRFVDKNYM